ncbi:phage holin family protein [Miniphocaeibacter massiliensis]|uniref:phage holin family protein n=1 Tax=Miniphocaeibacter massiliensis TaxID=2041841 RepID=UPI000C1BAFE6|nr:phage holin family protein [Miniphocaeibacter massiliensis]
MINFTEMFKNIWLQVILALILLDIFTGVFKAVKYKKLNSSFGIQGLGKHLAFFFVVIFATYVLKVTKLEIWLYAIYIIYAVFYSTSICENAYEAGWKIPKFVLKNLLVYQKAIDEGDLSIVLNVVNKTNKGIITEKDIEKKTTLTEEESKKLKELLEKAKLVESEVKN